MEQITIHPLAWYEKKNIELLRSARIVTLDTALKQIIDSKGSAHGFDRLVIAAGAFSRVPPIPGSDRENVFSMRTVADTMAIKKAALSAKQAIVIGGGLLGIETAYSLQTLGGTVMVIEVADRLLPQQLDEEGSSMIRSLLEAKSLRFLSGQQVQVIAQENRTLSVQLHGDGAITADMVVFSTGIRPNLTLAAGTPIDCRRGIVVDSYMRTSVEGIYACGDCTEFEGRVYGLWPAAREQGIAAGNHILGKDVPYHGTIPATRLKVTGVDIASIGDISGTDAIAASRHIDKAAGTYRKIFTRDGKIIGAILIGDVKDAVKLQKMIQAGEQINPNF
jgi:nitrite reductase (NADH) large subunit